LSEHEKYISNHPRKRLAQTRMVLAMHCWVGMTILFTVIIKQNDLTTHNHTKALQHLVLSIPMIRYLSEVYSSYALHSEVV